MWKNDGLLVQKPRFAPPKPAIHSFFHKVIHRQIRRRVDKWLINKEYL